MKESSELSLQDEEIPAVFNSANLLISSILPLAFILIICLCSSDFIQSRLSKTFSKSSKWGFLFQEFISQDDIDELNRQHDKGRQSRNQVANQTLQAANSDLSNEDLDFESSPLLGRNKNEGSRVGSSISDARPSGETTLALIAVPVVQLAAWTLVMAYQLVDSRGNALFYTAIAALLSWSYAFYRPIFRPQPTAEYVLLTFYIFQVMGSLLSIYDLGVFSLRSNSISIHLILQSCNLLMCSFAISIILRMPLQVHHEYPREDEEGHPPPMEDYCNLWSWLTFNWLNDLLIKGSNSVLETRDVWSLSFTLKTRLLLIKFLEISEPPRDEDLESRVKNVNQDQSSAVHDQDQDRHQNGSSRDSKDKNKPQHRKRRSLLYILFRANSKDIILDFLGTIFSSILSYSTPFFLYRILTIISEFQDANFSDASGSSSESDSDSDSISHFDSQRRTAYLYAVLALLLSLMKSQSDLQHLYYSRRACTRIKAELISAIYEKTLRKKDVRGTIGNSGNDKVKTGATLGDASDSKKKVIEGERENQAAADIGKIISLMAVDASRVGEQVAAFHQASAAPLDLVIATFFLVQLLGKSAFAGYVAIFLVSPIQSILTRRLINLSKSLASARDKRMSVLNEVISGLRFLKFFGQVEQWSEKVLSSRDVELSWLWRQYIYSSLLQLSWTLSPALFTFLSLASYTYLQGEELDAATAFTSLLVFGLLRRPMNIIPTQINEVLNTYVSVQRIQRFLEEDDVPDWASSLYKRRSSESSSISKIEDLAFGCENATFTWTRSKLNEFEKVKSTSPASLASRIFSMSSFWQKKQQSSEEAQRLLNESQSLQDETVSEAQDLDINNSPFQLKNLTISFPRGKMTLIAGSTSSGKSSLLNALLGEMDLTKGSVHLPKDPSFRDPETGLTGAVAYCPQQPWLQQCSIRDNILFGAPFEADRYNQVLDAAALRPDLSILESGDATEIGEKGVSLSGGQKARVALARALYSRASTVLMDDVLSALDANTSEKVFREALQGPLMKNRTLVMVTHHVELVLSAASWVVLLQDGEIEAQGTVEELRSQGFLKAASNPSLALEKKAEETQKDGIPVPGDLEVETSKPARQLVEEEKKAIGSVKLEVYQRYLKASSYTAIVIVVLLLLCFKMSDLLEKFWISFWTRSYDVPTSISLLSTGTLATSFSFIPHYFWYDPRPLLRSDSFHSQSASSFLKSTPVTSTSNSTSNFFNFPSASENVLPYVLVLFSIEMLGGFIWVMLTIVGYWSSIRGGRVLFSQMLTAVARSTSRWLDKTPSGIMTNRFSRDIETIDRSIQFSLRQISAYVIDVALAAAVIISSLPSFFLVAVGLAYIYSKCFIAYTRTARDIRRIESVVRSPIFSSFAELLDGVVSVRAFGEEKRFLINCTKRLDRATAAYWYMWMSARWVMFRYDTLGGFATFVALVLALSGGISPGVAGIVITQTQSLTQSLYWISRNWTSLEQDANSVERVVEFIADIPQEPAAIIEKSRPPAHWPSQGVVSVEGLEIRYAPELSAVLHGISFESRPCEKIGVVGRTGSGKSTLALAFFRFVEFSKGTISIDDIDITSFGLDDLRSRLTIIPQDAVLFSGTIRDNLDPFNEHTDDEVIAALRSVRIQTTPIASQPTSRIQSRPESPKGEAAEAPSVSLQVPAGTTSHFVSSTTHIYLTLETKVSSGGNSLSQGTRQLIAMARALLRSSRLIIMDEASSSIDFHTDSMIQETIRNSFKNATVITIAHRLATVVEYDRVLVLDSGKVAEFDTPSNLLANSESVFYSMCEKSGDFKTLKSVAGKRKTL